MPCSPTLSSLRRLWSRTAAPAGVAVARLRRRPGRNALLLTGIAAAVAMFVAVLGGTVVVRELSLQRLVRDLAPGDRSIRVDLVGLPALSEQLHPDAVARRALAELTPTDPIRVAAFRDFWLDGQFVRLGGIDGRRDHVRLLRVASRHGATRTCARYSSSAGAGSESSAKPTSTSFASASASYAILPPSVPRSHGFGSSVPRRRG